MSPDRSPSATLDPRHRRCVTLRGDAATTRAQARALIADLPPDRALWIGDDAPDAGCVKVQRSGVKRLLGQGFDAVILSLHEGLDADVLGQCHGLVWGGGALALRIPHAQPLAGRERLTVAPFSPADVTDHFWRRFERCLARGHVPDAAALTPLHPATRRVQGTAEQARLVDALAAHLAAPSPIALALTADRGRGKSSALGLALAAAQARADHTLRVVVSAASRDAVLEVLRFAVRADGARATRYVEPLTLALGGVEADVIVIDEAAQLPIPWLRRIERLHPRARLAFASTTHGYEGTGRGFALRFLHWLGRQSRPLLTFALREPIRWAPHDPLERLIFDALVLDADPVDPAALTDPPTASAATPLARATTPDPRTRRADATPDALDPCDPHDLDLEHRVLDRAALARDEQTLRDLFGLLVQAHYRTTPGDLHRMLDAPNLSLHVLLARGRVVAACMLAAEGGLTLAHGQALAQGRERIRGHALADTLICHAGHPEAGTLRMIRSVRIATHPALRRRGLARRLVEQVHAAHAPDLFGTLFGATPGLLDFRRALGYRLVRVGATRNARTGAPTAVMVRPVSPAAEALTATLQAELARDLPLELAWMAADDPLGLNPRLLAGLQAGLPAPAPLTPAVMEAAAHSYAFGARPLDAAACPVRAYVAAHHHHLAALPPIERALIEDRVLDGLPWVEVARRADRSIPSTMRALRRATRALLRAVDDA